VWLAPNIFGLYIYEILGIVIPVSLVPDDETPGCWRYCPGTGAIRWEGDFDAIAVFGRWACEVRTNYDLIIQTRFGLKWTDVALNTGDFITDWTNYIKTDDVHPTTLVIDNSQIGPIGAPPGFVATTCNASHGLRYAQIEALGIDRENTEPVSWSAPDDPW